MGSITSGLCPAAIASCLCFIDPTCLFSIQFVLKCGSLGFQGFPIHWGTPQMWDDRDGISQC